MSAHITAIMTCFNRKEKTVTCLKTLVNNNPQIDFSFIIVDDGSTDGTEEAAKNLGFDTEIIKGDGNLYWCGGMRTGIAAFLSRANIDDGYCLLVNDDVVFFERSIENMIERQNGRKDTVVVGATCDNAGRFTYGLKCREKWYKKNITKRIEPSDNEVNGEMFNANCVLIPNAVIHKAGNMDSHYTHGLGDYDYGFAMCRAGVRLISSDTYVGGCCHNSSKGTWNDKSLGLKERLKQKESPKGSPTKEWFYFLNKNFGLCSAIRYTVTAYIKLLLNL